MAGPLSRAGRLRPPPAPFDTQAAGRTAEDTALAYLEDRGLALVERNFLCRGGEIDLVMRDGAAIVFVEVRSRADGRYGGALASIVPAKLARMHHAAQVWLARCRRMPACRFDAVTIEGGQLHWLKNVLQ